MKKPVVAPRMQKYNSEKAGQHGERFDAHRIKMIWGKGRRHNTPKGAPVWKHPSLLKRTTGRILAVAVCLSVSGIISVCVSLQRTTGIALGNLGSAKAPALFNMSLDNRTQQSDLHFPGGAGMEDSELETHLLQSPFIVANRDKEAAKVLAQLSTRLDRTLKTFAVVWPCKGSQHGCFSTTRFPVQACRYNRCRQIWSLDEADVVVFYVFRIKTNEGVPQFHRPRNQRWVMLTPEAPARGMEFEMLDFPALKGQFNWTQTYRLDSDIPRIYGRLHRKDAPEKNYDQIYAGKSVLAAWFVSHCDTPSRRQQYVDRMQRVSNVHVYGTCGNYTCRNVSSKKRGLDKDQCLPLLSRTYFFYLAFENSLCRDYVTEKFFKTFLNVDVIAVVRGGADYKRFFPAGTFIDASDFTSPEALATFLGELARDKGRYLRMLKEKDRYRLWPLHRWFCDLCEKMHLDDERKFYPDLKKWYVQGQCREPDDM